MGSALKAGTPLALLAAVTIAIPIWQNQVSPVLDAATRLLLVTRHRGREVARKEIVISPMSAADLAGSVAELRVDALLCAAVSGPLLCALIVRGVRVERHVSGDGRGLAGVVREATVAARVSHAGLLAGPNAHNRDWRLPENAIPPLSAPAAGLMKTLKPSTVKEVASREHEIGLAPTPPSAPRSGLRLVPTILCRLPPPSHRSGATA